MNIRKTIFYTVKILRYLLLVLSFFFMTAAVFFAVLYFFVPRTYDWYLIMTSNSFLQELYLGSFANFLKTDAIVFFVGFFSYIISRVIVYLWSRFAFSNRTES